MKEPPINHEVALVSRSISLRHQDPADRFIAATALVFGLVLVTEDAKLANLKGVQVLSSTLQSHRGGTP